MDRKGSLAKVGRHRRRLKIGDDVQDRVGRRRQDSAGSRLADETINDGVTKGLVLSGVGWPAEGARARRDISDGSQCREDSRSRSRRKSAPTLDQAIQKALGG